jgi:putative DNA methylase
MTDTPYRKKLVETALPLEAINAACKEDKDRKTGTIRNLHKWFAPMPVPALRALIFASLVDDPGNDIDRTELLDLIEDLVASVVSDPSPDVLERAGKFISESVGELPIVLDPFCGGGSTLVEAQRLGLPSRGSDLNPIPVLISKALTEIPPALINQRPLHENESNRGKMFSEDAWNGLAGFVSDVEYYARRVREAAWSKLGNLYPLAPNGDPVVVWRWARTVESPDPRFQGARVPIVTNWWLSKRKDRLAFVQPVVDRDSKTISYEIATQGAPISTGKETCLFSGTPIPFSYIRDKGMQGEIGLSMFAVVAHGKHGRTHLVPDQVQIKAAEDAVPQGLANLDLPQQALGFRVQGYGISSWSMMFTNRQQTSLEIFSSLVAEVPAWIRDDGGSEELVKGVVTILGLCVGKLAQMGSMFNSWRIDSRNGAGQPEAVFGQHTLSMSWDFAETNPFGGSRGDWMQIVETSTRALGFVHPVGPASVVVQGDARQGGSGLGSSCLVVTDPPYFAAIGYANLSDFFYPWIRRALRDVYPDLLSTMATPKNGELIAEPARHGSEDEAKQYFIDGFRQTFTSLKMASRSDLPILIVYAYKEQEAEKGSHVSTGWEAMLEAVIRSGLAITGTWPIHGTGSSRMRGQKSNALATYVVLVCRPRLETSSRTSRRELSAELRSELGPAVDLLKSTAIAPVDLSQAVIGPGMGIFTRYSSILEPDGSSMTVRSALLLINSILAEILDEQEGEFDADTRWTITWFEQFQFAEAPSGIADALARTKVTSIDGLVRAGIIVTRGGTCRLLRRDELPENYDPVEDQRATVWESVQHLVKQLLVGGEERAAGFLAHIANREAARNLAYRLYAICERKGWAEEAGAYNVLVASWPEIARLAAQLQVQQRHRGQLPGFE